MRLGIIVNTDRHADHLVGLTTAALAQKHELEVFLTDVGVRLLQDPAVHQLAHLQGVVMSFCMHSAAAFGIAAESIDPEIIAGSQLNNAIMTHHADKVIVL